jgi:hypothetical protein
MPSNCCLASELLGVQLSPVVEFGIVILKKFTYSWNYCWPYCVDCDCVHVRFLLLSGFADLDSCFCFLIDILPSLHFSVTCCKGITKKLEIFSSRLRVITYSTKFLSLSPFTISTLSSNSTIFSLLSKAHQGQLYPLHLHSSTSVSSQSSSVGSIQE